jgi:Trypsin-like peptidase domain
MALLPPFFLDTVVAVGVGDDSSQRRWIASGFLYGVPVTAATPATPSTYRLWLVTNKHVLSNHSSVFLKFNSARDGSSADYPIFLKSSEGTLLWIGHPNESTDVAVIFLNAQFLQENSRRFAFFEADHHCMARSEMRERGLTEGDRCFVLGYPMGLVSAHRQYVICRSGVFARIRDYLDEHTTDYLVDAPVFPGNSGGPVILCPSANPIPRSALVGIVKAYVPYIDTAISPQTGRPRITFEENSGLSSVEPLDAIVDTIALAERELLNNIADPQQRTTVSTRPAETTLNDTRNPETS